MYRIIPEDGPRYIQPQVQILNSFDPDGHTASKAIFRQSSEGDAVSLVLDVSGKAHYARVPSEGGGDDLFGDEEAEPISRTLDGEYKDIILSRSGDRLALLPKNGRPAVLDWDSDEQDFISASFEGVFDRPISSLGFVYGDAAIVLGHDDGSISGWQRVARQQGGFEWRKTKSFTKQASSITFLSHSFRDKTFITLDKTGTAAVHFYTSEREIFRIQGENLTRLGLSQRNNGLIGLTGSGALKIWELDAPHPEISGKTLLGKVHYIDYNKPEFVWQSTGGSDEYEPKLSVVPPNIRYPQGYLLFAALCSAAESARGDLFEPICGRPCQASCKACH